MIHDQLPQEAGTCRVKFRTIDGQAAVSISYTPKIVSWRNPHPGVVMLALAAVSFIAGLVCLLQDRTIGVLFLVLCLPFLVGAWTKLAADVISTNPKLVAAVRDTCEASPHARSRAHGTYVMTGPESSLVLRAATAVAHHDAVAPLRRKHAARNQPSDYTQGLREVIREAETELDEEDRP